MAEAQVKARAMGTMRAPPRPKDAEAKRPLSYADYLEAQAHDPKQRKGQRTAARLKAATARLLDESGYRDLRVTDINERAGVSNALFYVYYKNKEVISEDVLQGFLEHLDTFRQRDEVKESSEQTIYYGNLRYAQIFKHNIGLMRCLFQFSDEFPSFARHWQDWNARWRDRVLRSLDRARALATSDPVELSFTVGVLGQTVDSCLRLLLIDADPNFAQPGLRADAETLALLLTRIWVRSLFARDMEWIPGT